MNLADLDLPCGAAAPHLLMTGAGLLGLLIIGSIVALVLRRTARSEPARRLAADVSARVQAWWWMCLACMGALLGGQLATTVLFALLSFLAFREFITLAPTRRADHRTLFWAFFVVIPLHYVITGIGWYGMFAIFIPVWGFLFIAIRSTLAGDATRYLERTAKVQWGLMLCVYAVSHLPALLMLDIPGFSGRQAELLLWLLLVVQLSDVLQYAWGKALGRRRVAPHLSPSKTWEGLIGGAASASAIGAALWWLTPFTPVQALGMAAGATALGFAGGVVMSAVKRDAGVKDFGDLIPGHGGILDRVDSLTFAAPACFHLIRYYWVPA
jgi:phosphatidate cytidylyltransferase